MWLSRSEYERLRGIEITQGVTKVVHSRELREMARRMQSAERRAAEAESALSIERHDNSRTVRHLINSVLRAKEIGAYPLPVDKADKPAAASHRELTFEESVDPGELEAVIAAGAAAGVSRDEAIAFLRKEKGFA